VISVRNGRPARARLAALGAYAPERVVTNAELATRVDTSDEWIVTRTGIRERRFAAPDETAGDMAVAAAERVLASAGVAASQIDMVIVPTGTPDAMFPSTAALVAHRIGARDAAAFDMSAACSGFVYGLAQAAALVEGGLARTVLVVGSEVLSRVTDQTDRATCILFADGAGGALVVADDDAATTGFLGFDLGADGSGGDDLVLPASGDREAVPGGPVPASGCIRMDGPAVFRFATRIMVQSTERLLAALEMGIEDIDLVVAHQANSRIIDHAAERLAIPSERIYNTLERYGNTSSASIPMALAEARDAGRLRPGGLLLLVGFGGGLTWGSTVVRYEPLGAEVPA
jgi:3-oxoacyl-[acyl-carrier-protein] synthase-3